ncbi:prepilin-type N-terminal cleavage/methylation domain-containing protein [Photobacterium sp. 1_MG-2023]|uniref:type IV pilus modification PilV family protein n=1 Tax=Photobacterium sp. 1_MG-2023 TaxID=3062646 RepID=UPI0026E2B489|nr:prepilin-type N-terminal cleavage/methylation domain-containing protein [Photobacterium sp. 1_MG-2023]MDO6704685.1 prepilin-type N-terminal cleavage/methylation domain-containing protein [Photobacterium sp. 1_MG-2023]
MIFRRNPNHQKGGGLLEVLVAMVLVSVGLAGLMKLQAYLNLQADNALVTLSAVTLAESRLERVLARQPESISGSREALRIRGTEIEITQVIHPQPGRNGLYRIGVSVAWQDRWQQGHHIEIYTEHYFPDSLAGLSNRNESP